MSLEKKLTFNTGLPSRPSATSKPTKCVPGDPSRRPLPPAAAESGAPPGASSGFPFHDTSFVFPPGGDSVI